MLRGSDAKRGYMRWWHSFQGVCPTTQETRTFFVEYSILNPALGAAQPILGQHPYYRRHGMKPSYLCMKAGVFPKDGDGGLQLQSTVTVLRENACFHAEIGGLHAVPSVIRMLS